MPTSYAPGSAEERLHERYRTEVADARVWNPVIDLMLQHRSVRAYSDKALPAGTLESLVAAAQSAATSSNLQTWSVVAIHDQARRDRLAAFAGNQRHIRQAPLFLVWLADLSRAERLGAAVGKNMAALPYLESFLVAVIDAALAAQNATVAAESLGLGTVYIGAIRNNPEGVSAELRLPSRVMPVFGLCVGYEDETQPAASVKPRLPPEAILHHETYAADHEPAAIQAYDKTLQAFQAEQAMKSQAWSDLVRARLGDMASMSGREHLRQAVNALGHELE